jgi:hypothetical protein
VYCKFETKTKTKFISILISEHLTRITYFEILRPFVYQVKANKNIQEWVQEEIEDSVGKIVIW